MKKEADIYDDEDENNSDEFDSEEHEISVRKYNLRNRINYTIYDSD